MAWIDALFKRMVEVGASDLHMTSNTKPQFRLHGDIVPVKECDAIPPDQMQLIFKEICIPSVWETYEATFDADFAYEIPGLARFRGNLFVDSRGPAATFRVIPEELLTFEELNLPDVARDFCMLSKGLVLVTGPTGSGKSTTLAAMIDFINKNRPDHIITIEDPIEFVHQDQRCLINQREVKQHTASFKRALKAALREDPDIVLVGELRDLETIEIAIETAETGHLVFGTLHTTTAPSTVDRIIDQFPADRQAQIRTMLSSSLKGVVAQTLCKRQAGGRVAALEVLAVNSAVSSLIREGKTHQIMSVMQMGGKSGMVLQNDALTKLVVSGEVTPEEAYSKSIQKDGFVDSLQAAGVHWQPGVVGQPVMPASPLPAAPMDMPADMTPEHGEAYSAAPGPASAPPPAPALGLQPSPEPALPNDGPTQEVGGEQQPLEDPFEQYKRQRG